MKKLLLIFGLLFSWVNFMAHAEDVTVDVSSVTGLPTKNGPFTNPVPWSSNNVDFTFSYCYLNSGYVMVYAQGTSNSYGKAYIELKTNSAVSKIIVNTTSSSSPNANLQLYADGVAVGSAVAPSNQKYTFDIPSQYQKANTTFKLASTVNYNAQVTTIVLTKVDGTTGGGDNGEGGDTGGGEETEDGESVELTDASFTNFGASYKEYTTVKDKYGFVYKTFAYKDGGIQINGTKYSQCGIIVSEVGTEYKISTIDITFGDANKGIDIYSSSTPFSIPSSGTIITTGATKINSSVTSGGKFTIDNNAFAILAPAGNNRIKSIKVTYVKVGDDNKDTELVDYTFPEVETTMTEGDSYVIDLGSDYPAGLTLISDNDAVTVTGSAPTFTVTAASVGSATLKASWPADTKYTEGSKTFDVTVSPNSTDPDPVDPTPGGDGTLVDVLNNANTYGGTGSTYKNLDPPYTSDVTGAVYAVNCAGGDNTTGASIQLRSDIKNSMYAGIVSTTSGGILKKIIVTFNTNTSNPRTLDIYASNTAYTGTSDLYSDETKGKKVTAFTFEEKGNTFEYTFDDEYKYIGLRSPSGALYLEEVRVEWEKPEPKEYVFPVDKFPKEMDEGTSQTIDLGESCPTNMKFKSSNVGVIEAIYNQGKVILNAEQKGDATITVTWDADVNYKASPEEGVTFTINVVEKPYIPSETADIINYVNIKDGKVTETAWATYNYTDTRNGANYQVVTKCESEMMTFKGGDTFTTGFVTTKTTDTPSYVKSVKVRVIRADVNNPAEFYLYGSHEPFTSCSNLYGESAPKYIAQYFYSGSEPIELTYNIPVGKDYEYIGLGFGAGNDIYTIEAIEIEWEAMPEPEPEPLSNVYKYISSDEELDVGGFYVMATDSKAMSTVKTNNIGSTENFEIEDGYLTITGDDVLIFTLEEKDGKKAFKTYNYIDNQASNQGYIKYTSGKVDLSINTTFSEDNISFTGGNVILKMTSSDTRNIKFGTTDFRYYAEGNGTPIKLYKNVAEVDYPIPSMPEVKVNGEVLTADGIEVAAGASVEITCENAYKLVGSFGETPFEVVGKKHEFKADKTGVLTVKGVNKNEEEGEEFTATITIGTYDENMPAVGARFKQMKRTDLETLKEDYYIIARNTASVKKAFGKAALEKALSASSSFTSEAVSTGTQNFNLVSTTDNDVLIVKLEKNADGVWGIKTVNYGNGLSGSQGYLTTADVNDPKGTSIVLSKEFAPAYIDLISSGSVRISFTENTTPEPSDPDSTEGDSTEGGNDDEGEPVPTVNRYIGYDKDTDSFKYYTGGDVIQLYHLTEAKVFEPNYPAETTIRIGDAPWTIETGVAENPSELKYRSKGNAQYFTVTEDGVLTPNKYGSNYVVAEWPETDEWFEGKREFFVWVRSKLSDLQDPMLGFQNGTEKDNPVRGKIGVGVVAQAANHLSPGKITYTSSNPFVVVVDSETGMIRQDGVVGVGEAVITASIEETEFYRPEDAQYYIVIEKADIHASDIPTTGSFVFKNNTYGLWPVPSGMSTKYEQNRNDKISPDSDSYVAGEYHGEPVTEIVSTNNPELKINFAEGTNYRYWANESELRVHSGCTMTISVPEECSITKIEFTGSLNNMSLAEEQAGSYSSGTWTASESESTNAVSFKATGTVQIKVINVTLDVPSGGSDTDVKLSFDESERVRNFFVDEVEQLPTLNLENIDIEDVKFDIDEEGSVGDNDDYYTINHDAANALSVVVNKSGVFTLRAYAMENEVEVAKAILRLNVFPSFNLKPEEIADEADDERTKNHNLTLVNSTTDSDGNTSMTIQLPTKENYLHGSEDEIVANSTIDIVSVAVKEVGQDDETVYTAEDLAKTKTHTFTNDGYVKYTYSYAGVEDFQATRTVKVIAMPEVPKFDFDNNILTPSKNARLRYRAYLEDQSRRAKSINQETDWVDADIDETMEVTHPNPQDGRVFVVEFLSLKRISDLNQIMDEDAPMAIDDDDEIPSQSGAVGKESGGGFSGLDSIFGEGAEGDVEVYNLQGIRVNAPLAPGFYIVSRGGVATTVYVK